MTLVFIGIRCLATNIDEYIVKKEKQSMFTLFHDDILFSDCSRKESKYNNPRSPGVLYLMIYLSLRLLFHIRFGNIYVNAIAG